MVPPLPPPSATTSHGGRGTLSALHPDILHSHILSRLDGPALASTACASAELHALSTDDELWKAICSSSWPSINDPRVAQLISTFPSGHRSFFSDSYPLLHHHHHSNLDRPFPSMMTEELISAVDIYYKEVPIFSKVVENETVTGWFMCSPFRVDLLEPKETAHTCIRRPAAAGDGGLWLQELEKNLSLSWILIDPQGKRAMNVSSLRPVSVERHWLTGEAQVKFAALMAGDGRRGSEKEFVECGVVVTCGGKEGGEVHVRDVSMSVEDMEGQNLCGSDSLVILQRAMEMGERKRGRSGKEGKEMYEEFVQRKKVRKERKERRESALDFLCIFIRLDILLAFFYFLLFK